MKLARLPAYSLAVYSGDFTLITRTARACASYPSCVAVYSRDPDRDVFYVARPARSILPSSFLALTLHVASINTPKFEATYKTGKTKNGGDWDGRNNCRENYELIHRSESGDRGGDELRRVDRGRHGSRIVKPADQPLRLRKGL